VLIAAGLTLAGFGPLPSPDDRTAAPLAVDASEPEVHYHPGRPAHIHQGSCATLGEVAFPLNPVGAGAMTGVAMADIAAMPMGETVGSPEATAVEIGRITLDVPVQNIAAGGYALNVQISEFEYGNYIACGDIPGVMSDDTLTFGLAERNGSGFTGMAIFQGKGEQTEVAVYLAQGLLNAPDGGAIT